MAAPGPIARLFGSLANTLLDLGLPRIRAWVRERLGPDADVASVRADGSLIHLGGVRLPIGPRGRLVLERATAAITSSGGLRGGAVAMPEVRLHAFEGALSFGDGDHRFEADVVFTAAPEPDAAAWVQGELAITRATWSARVARADAPEHAPMRGRADLVVTSTTWRLDEGRLESEHADVRFAGRGSTDASDAKGALSVASLSLEGARVGPFVDAIGAMIGSAFEVPSVVPLDARLSGTIELDATVGGKCNLHVKAEALRFDLQGTVGPDGGGLDMTLEGEIAAAALARKAGLPSAFVPRDEDRFAVSARATGDSKSPDVVGSVRAPEIGLRFGRPRFQPALLVKAIEAAVEVHGKAVTVDASARAGRATIAASGGLDGVRLRANDLEPAWLVSLAKAAGVSWLCEGEPPEGSFAIPSDALTAVDVTIERPFAAKGSVSAATASSRLAVGDLAIQGGALTGRVTGTLSASDALAVGLFPFDIRPTAEGAATLDLALLDDGSSKDRGAFEIATRGQVTMPRLAIEIRSRPDVPPFVLEDVSTTLAIDRRSLRYSDGRFRAYGGSFLAEGVVPFAPEEGRGSPPRLVVQARDAGASFAEAVARLARGRLKVRVERDGARPADEIWIPRSAKIAGEFTLASDMSTSAEIALETAPRQDGAASALLSSFRMTPAPELRVDGSTIRGTLAIADALVAGAFDTTLRPLPEGTARIDATLKGAIDDVVLSGFATVPKIRVAMAGDSPAVASSPVLFATDVTTLFRVDTTKIVWQRFEAQAYGGRIESAGVIGFGDGPSASGASFVGLQSTVTIRDVSLGHVPSDRAGTPLAELAFGRLGLEMRFDRRGESGPVLGRGFARLDEAAFPAVQRAGPALARYGLEPPDARATGPATAEIVLGEHGWTFANIAVAVLHMDARGDVRLGFDGSTEGLLIVHVGESFLAASPLLVLPSILAERLTIPVRIHGGFHGGARPRVHADLAACFNRFVTDNRVSAFVSEAAAEVAELFTGRKPAPPAPAVWPPPAPPSPPAPLDEDAIIRELVAKGADWDEIEERLEEHRRGGVRYRIE